MLEYPLEAPSGGEYELYLRQIMRLAQGAIQRHFDVLGVVQLQRQASGYSVSPRLPLRALDCL